jgi:hypothetical protein
VVAHPVKHAQGHFCHGGAGSALVLVTNVSTERDIQASQRARRVVIFVVRRALVDVYVLAVRLFVQRNL